MAKSRTTRRKQRDPIPETDDVEVLSEFWDTHSVADYWDEFQPVKAEFDIEPMPRYVALEKSLAQRVQQLAAERGVSVETLVNLWVNEKASVHLHQ
jgi:hypothetical protein